ncbi:MAG: 2-hydroxyacid dehydrogenase [Micrococcales bacterium]|nr:2-hydroxyacid dehydrogenase [Micrococcales bacterium]
MASLPDDSWIADIGPVDGLELVQWDLTGPPPREDIGLVVPPYLKPATLLAATAPLPALEAVQLLTAGYDGVREQLAEGVQVANAAGVHDASTAELAVALTLASLRRLPEFVLAQRRGEWLRPADLPSLADRRVLVLGYGSVGRAIARRLLPFEVELTAVASRAREGDDLVERVHGIDELPGLLPEQDVVIVVVPLTEATRTLVDMEFLARMRAGALLVNIARGPVADTGAIMRHVGRLRFALDVTDPEPLREDHPLWHAEGVLISPHTGGNTSAFRPRAVRLLREQLGRYAAGEPLANVVAPVEG